MIFPPRNFSAGQKNFSRAKFRRSLAFAAAMAALFAGTRDLRAASANYTGTAADNNFDTGTNWSTGTAPGDTTVGDTTNQDIATFALATGAAITEATQRNLLGITFGGAGTFTIGTTTGAAFLLSSGGTIIANGSSGSQNVNAPLVLENAASMASGTYTFESDTPGTSRTTTIGGSVTGAATAGGSTVLTLTGTSAGTGGAGNTISGAVTDGTGGGTLAISKTGTGTWALNGTNTYTGGTTITAGTLRTSTAASTTAFGTGAITLSGGTVAFAATTSTITNPFVITAGTTNFLNAKGGTFSPSALTGTGNLTFSPNGTGVTDSFTDFKNFAGTVEVQNSVFLRAITGVVQNSLQNASLVLDTGGAFTENIGTNGTATIVFGSVAGGGTFGASAAGGGTFTYQVGGNNTSTTFSGVIAAGGTATALTKVGTGTLTLTGANTYTGLTTISAGTLNINGVNALGGGNYSGLTINGGTLQYATGATGNGSLDISNNAGTAKPVTFGASGATIDTNGNNVTYANTVGNGGTGSLTKAGTGILTLAAANTYTGGTIINAGTLIISLNGGLSSGNTTVAGGAVLELSTGVTAANSNTTSTLTLSATNSTLMLDGPAGTVQDTVRSLILAGTALPNGTYGAVGSTTVGVIPLPEITGTGVLVVVPEPGTWVFLFGGMAGLTALAVRRRRTA